MVGALERRRRHFGEELEAYVGYMQTAQGKWYGWIIAPREPNKVVWSLTDDNHKPVLLAIKAELKRLGIERPKLVAEWPDTIRPPGVN